MAISVMRISTSCGSPCGRINLDLTYEGIRLGKGYALSLRDVLRTRNENVRGVYELGNAKCMITGPTGTFTAEGPAYDISIESTSVPDFIALHREVLKRFGLEPQQIAPSLGMYPPNEQSFVRGIGNDLRRLKQYIAAQAAHMRRKLGFKIFAH